MGTVDEKRSSKDASEQAEDAAALVDTNNKRKVDNDESSSRSENDTAEDEPRAKRQRQEDPVEGSSGVDNDGGDPTTTQETENCKDNDEKDSNSDSPDETKNDSPDTEMTTLESTDKKDDDNDPKDMDIEPTKDPSSDTNAKASETKVTNGENESDKTSPDGDTKDAAPNSVADDSNTRDVPASEEKKDDSPIDEATGDKDGQTVSDPNNSSSNPYDKLKYIMVRNDGKPESLIKLVALKSLFSRQLPKMPRTYIARLVFDRRHTSLVILNDDPATKDTDEEVIGSICYRAFPEMRFAEIAFCAVNASHQVKGYGTKLMNLVKKEGARTGIEYFITYADNYAIGYFKKQGFTKTISMPKGRYQGLIKEYDGGTMMECYVHPSIDFTRIPGMLAAQREFILSRIRLKALSHKVVYPPLPKNWKPHLEGVSRANEAAARALAVPGMIEAGWTLQDLMSSTGQGKDLDRAKNALKSELISITRKVEEQQFSWPFREPVDTNEVKDYLEIIKEPIDLMTIDKRIRKGDHYKSKKMLYADLMLMVNNCKLYNDETSTYTQCALNLERYLKTLFAAK